MQDPAFVQRLNTACNANRNVPVHGDGRQAYIKRNLNLSGEAVRKWFAGESRPRQQKMKALAALLGVDESWLALGIESEASAGGQRLCEPAASGAVNVFLGLMQMNGGRCTFLNKDDPAAAYTSFCMTREGGHTAYHVAEARVGTDGSLSFDLPIEYERCALVGAVQVGPLEVRFLRLPHELVKRHAVAYADRYTLKMKEDPEHEGLYVTGADHWAPMTLTI